MIVLEDFVTEPFDQVLASSRRILTRLHGFHAQLFYFDMTVDTVGGHILGTADLLLQ